jgi:hypothetical protein
MTQKQPVDTAAIVEAEMLLKVIASCMDSTKQIDAEHQAAVERIDATFIDRLAPVTRTLDAARKDLIGLMRTEKRALFGVGDIRKLENGVLLRQLLEKVQIPRDALAKCEELGFDEVIRIAKSLDRAAVEKWTDERLFLIGATRKTKEEFNYELAKKQEAQ